MFIDMLANKHMLFIALYNILDNAITGVMINDNVVSVVVIISVSDCC